MKPATIVIASVEVMCPHCRDLQPNPDNGAHTWLPSEIDEASAQARQEGRAIVGMKCVHCDLPFFIRTPSWLSANGGAA